MHIPFCRYRCHYCDFYLESRFSGSLVSKTLENIIREAKAYVEILHRAPPVQASFLPFLAPLCLAHLRNPSVFSYNTQASVYHKEAELSTKKNFFLESLLMGLRRPFGISLSHLSILLGEDLQLLIENYLKKSSLNSINTPLFYQKNRLSLKPSHRFYLNTFLQDIYDYIPSNLEKQLIFCTSSSSTDFYHQKQRNPLKTLYIGGGTPSIIEPWVLKNFIEKLKGIFEPLGSFRELSVEVNPEDVSEALLQNLLQAGVLRVSIGIQTFDEEALKRVGRYCSVKENHRALRLLEHHFGGDASRSFSVDILCGLPYSENYSPLKDWDILQAYTIPHFSVYQLSVEPKTKLHSLLKGRQLVLPEETLQEDWWFALKERLEAQGYEHYEVSSFALPGHQSLHNRRYWAMQSFLGLGPGASSFVPVRFLDPKNL